MTWMTWMTCSTWATLIAQAAAVDGNTDGYLVAALILGGVGLVLLAIEIFVPTGGLLAILTAVAFIASVVAMFMWSSVGGLLLLVGYTAAAPLIGAAMLKLWSKSPLVRKYTLNSGPSRVVKASASDESDIDTSDPEAAQAANDHARLRRVRDLASLTGERGVAETPLRPAGFVLLHGRRIDAVAESGLIEPGTPVRVVGAIDGTLKVRAD